MKRIWVSLLGWGILAAFAATGYAEEPTLRELYRAKRLSEPAIEQELGRDVYHRTWDLSQPDRGNFTFFSPQVKDLQVTGEGVLRFRAGGEKVTLGWGNYLGKQPYAERTYFWTGNPYVCLKVKQSAPESNWAVIFWSDGRWRRGRTSPKATLKGTDWKELKFEDGSHIPADGFQVIIQGPKENVIEIESLRITRTLRNGYFRKEFEIPQGQIWRAVAEVSRMSRLYINGQEIETYNSIWHHTCWGGVMYQTIPVDLAPYLKPGNNCIGLYSTRTPSSPCTYFQGQVVMRSGEVIRLDSDETWQVTPQAEPGWSKVGFDASDWKSSRTADPAFYHLRSTLPTYDGRVVIENPYDATLFYTQEKPVALIAKVPEGLAAQRPTLSWVIEQVGYEKSEERGRGEVRNFRQKDGSLIYEINVGRLERGVYTAALTLKTGEEIVEERYREPFIVIGKIPMKEVEGKTYEEGLKLTLEDTVDFTNPRDPHPWVESDATRRGEPVAAITTPHIVRKGNLVYRETQPRRSAMFSYRVQFQKPDSFYLMVLEYPNDSERFIGVSCTNPTGWQSKAGPSVWTGEKLPVTNTMQELRWIYRPGPGPHTVDIVSMQSDTAAAARRLRIYRIEELPALRVNDSGQRRLGILTERTTLSSGFGVTFGIQPQTERVPVSQAVREAPEHCPITNLLQSLVWKLDACEAYTRYLRFTGQNLHVMGCVQYDENNTPFTPPRRVATSRLPTYGLGGSAAIDQRDIAVRVFGQNGIEVIASIEYWGHKFFECGGGEDGVSDAQVAAGADTLYMVSRTGKQQWWYNQYGVNHLHPKIERLMLMMVDDLTQKFKDQPNFLGVNWTPYIRRGWMPIYPTESGETALGFGYDDVTIARFEKDTKIRVPVDNKDPQRFQKRYDFLTAPAMKEKWIEWRCQNIRQFFLAARDRMRAQRKDLDFFVSLDFLWTQVQEWTKSGKTLQDFMRERGYDPSLYRKDEALWFNRWVSANQFAAPAYRREAYAPGWERNVGKDFLDLYARKENRAIVITHHWDENTYRAPDEAAKAGWPYAEKRGRLHVQANGDNAREAFTQALIGSDPEMVIFGFMDVNLLVGHEQQLREFAQVLRALPQEQFSPVLGTGFQTNLAIRDLRKAGAYYFYVANPGYWPIKGSVTLSSTGRVVDLAANRLVETRKEGGNIVLPVSLDPYGIAAYRTDGSQAKVVSWKTQPVDDKDLAHLRGMVERADTLLRDRKAVAVLSSDELAFMQKAVAQAKADLAGDNYARAWSTVTNWRFWILLHEQMKKAAQLGAGISPGGKPIDTAVLPTLEVTCTKAAPKIDGKLNDPAWKQAKPGTGFIAADKRPSMVATTVRLAYDAKNIYLAFECADSDPASLRRTAQAGKGEGDVWTSGDDAIAMFLQPNPQTPIYYQMGFSAGGLKFDQRVVGGDKDYDFAPPWEVATSVTKNAWTAEVMIPLASLSATANPGKAWRANFFRRFRLDRVPVSFWSWVSGSAHDSTRFGKLRFLPPS